MWTLSKLLKSDYFYYVFLYTTESLEFSFLEFKFTFLQHLRWQGRDVSSVYPLCFAICSFIVFSLQKQLFTCCFKHLLFISAVHSLLFAHYFDCLLLSAVQIVYLLLSDSYFKHSAHLLTRSHAVSGEMWL